MPAPGSLEAQRADAQTKANDGAIAIEALSASAERLRGQVRTTAASVAKTEQALTEARQRASDAARQAKEARSSLARLQIQTQQINQRIRNMAVAAYIAPDTFENLEVVSSEDPTSTLRRQTFASIATGTDQSTLETFRARRQDINALETAAKDAEARQRKSERTSLATLKTLNAEKRSQQDQLDDLAQKIDEMALQVEEWRGIDESLTKQIDERNAQLARFLAQQAAAAKAAEAKAAADAALAAKAEAAAKTASSSSTSTSTSTSTTSKSAKKTNGASGSTTSTSSKDVSSTSMGAGGTGNGTPLPPGDPRWAYAIPGYPPPPAEWKAPVGMITFAQTEMASGIRVKSSIAPQVRRMVAAAAADGVALKGAGYRKIETQIQIRYQRCGHSSLQVWVNPSTTCTIPTAPPGTSRHQNGVAIDFDLRETRSCVGAPKPCSGSPAYDWLVRRAAEFGFYNWPRESWHWSIDGK